MGVVQMRGIVFLVILIVGIIWGVLPHLNKHGMRVEGITVYTAKRYTTAAIVLLLCAGVHQLYFQTQNSTPPMTFSVAVVSGIISAVSFLAYMWCLSENEPSVVTSLVYVLGLLFAAISGAYIQDEALTTRQQIGVCVSIVACALLC